MTGRKKDRDPDQGHVRMTLEDRHPVMLLYGIPFFIYVIPARMVNKQQKPRFAGGSLSRSLDQSQLMHFELTKRGRRKWIEESLAEELRANWKK